MTLLRRVFSEKRGLLIPLAVAMLANLAMYGFVVRPLGVRSTGAARRAESARTARESAERDLAAAEGIVSGKARADQDLLTFYEKKVPAGLSAARLLTYTTLPALARRTNVQYLQSQRDVDASFKSQQLGHLKIQMTLQGEWENVRRFVYELEATPSFIIIDQVTLAQNEQGQPLTLNLELSTYYRLEGHDR